MNSCTNCGQSSSSAGSARTAERRRRPQRPPAATPPSGRPWAAPTPPPSGERAHRAHQRAPRRPRRASRPVEPPPAYTGQLGRRQPLPAVRRRGRPRRRTAARPPAEPRTATTGAPQPPALAAGGRRAGGARDGRRRSGCCTRDGTSGDSAADQPAGDSACDQPAHRRRPDAPGTTSTSPAGSGRQPGRPRGRRHRDRAEAAPPGQDVGGNPVSYAARQHARRRPRHGVADARRRHRRDAGLHAARADGDAARWAWSTATPRTDGGGGRTFNWYLGNRRILKVEWVFDDGTTVAAGPALRAGAADHRRRQGAHQHDLAADPRGVTSGSRRAEQERDRDQRRPAPRRSLIS